MKKILMLSLALLSVAGTQTSDSGEVTHTIQDSQNSQSSWAQPQNRNFTNPAGYTNMPNHTLTTIIKTAIKNIDPKDPTNVAKAHALKATALSIVGNSSGIIAPNMQSQLTQWINTLESEETLFVIGSFLMSLLGHVEHYRALYHQGATIEQTAIQPTPAPSRIASAIQKFAPGQVVESGAPINSGSTLIQPGDIIGYTATPASSIDFTNQAGMVNRGMLIKVSQNAQLGTVKIYQTVAGNPGDIDHQKTKRKLYKTITVVANAGDLPALAKRPPGDYKSATSQTAMPTAPKMPPASNNAPPSVMTAGQLEDVDGTPPTKPTSNRAWNYGQTSAQKTNSSPAVIEAGGTFNNGQLATAK